MTKRQKTYFNFEKKICDYEVIALSETIYRWFSPPSSFTVVIISKWILESEWSIRLSEQSEMRISDPIIWRFSLIMKAS